MTLDVGTKQQKTLSQAALLHRPKRSLISEPPSWWSHWRRQNSYSLVLQSFFYPNANDTSPFFPRSTSIGHFAPVWFEEMSVAIRL